MRWFAQPWALWLLLALPAVSLLFAWARWRRRHALRRLGTQFLIERLVLVRPRLRCWQSILLLLGLSGLIVGVAGPRWGVARHPELLSGKDIVVVLDMSKSMLAEQPSRFERARRSLRDLADGLEARGGHRLALVVFAAHAKLQFPLTGDYDHFRFALDKLDVEHIAPALRPQVGEKIASGTRLGEALRLAASAHAVDRAGRQDIVLLSDGDDPAADDDEWAQGVQAAHQRNIPVHVVAIGDPRGAHPIRTGNDVLHHGRAVVQTMLNEPLLQEIARRTHGIYFPAHANSLPLGRLLRGHLDSESASAPADAHLLQAELHYGWFMFSALLLLGGTMLMGDGLGPSRRFVAARATSETVAGSQINGMTALTRFAVVALLPMFMSAEPLASVEDLVRQGNTAFARQEFELALQLYAQAAPTTADPGLVAFNQGAALYRQGRFDEAAAHYQRCLEDQAIPPKRLARASYDLGTALVQAGSQDRRRLEQAIAAFRRCLESRPAADLQKDALYNLELAKWLWIQAKPSPNTEPPNTPDQGQDPSTPPDRRGNGQTQVNAKSGPDGTDDGGSDQGGVERPGMNANQKKLAHGPLQVLPDTDKLQPLTPEDTAAHLDQLITRIQRERRSYWQQAPPASANVKDW